MSTAPLDGQDESDRMVSDTLAAWLARWAAATPEAPAVIDSAGTVRLTYAQLAAQSRAIAVALHELGIGHGDVVAVQLPNVPEFIALYLGIGLCRATVQTLHMPYRAPDLEPLLRHSGARVAAVTADTKGYCAAEAVLALRGRLPNLRHVISVGGDVPGTHSYARWMQQPGGRARLPPAPRPDDLFVLLYTSGTTAHPKGVPATYRQFLGNARHSVGELEIDAQDRLLSAAPFSHLYGLYTLHLALCAGAASVLLPVFSPADLAHALRRTRPMALFAAPAHLAACLDQGLLDRGTLATLDYAMTAGSLCPVPVARTVQQLMPNGKFLQLWGMSELQAGAFTRPADPVSVRLTCAGRASPDIALRVVDASGAAVPCGTEGELQVRGSPVFSGYRDNPEADAASFTADGWFRTGDLAALDGDGNLRITGRIKELINRGGVKINPTDVEALLMRHPAVAQCALVPFPDQILGERICCAVSLKPDQARPTLDQLLAWLEQQGVTKLYWPERLEFIEAMPMTPTRKVIKGKLARLIAESAATPPDSVAA